MIQLSQYLMENVSLIFEADGSWGEQFESIICNAWNSKGESIGAEYEKLALSHGIKDPAELAQSIYASLSKVMKDSPLDKLPNKEPATNEWIKLGMYTKKPNNTPKTDIISADSQFKISVKEESGARLMSGAVNETIATLRVAIDNSGVKELQDIAEKIFNDLQGKKTRVKITGTTEEVLKKLKAAGEDAANDDESMSAIRQVEDAKDVLAGLIEEIKKYPTVYEALLYEAITGSTKFGPNAKGCANYVLTWDKNGHCEMYTIDEYIKKFGSQYKIYATYKSSRDKVKGVKVETRRAWMVMTLSN